MCEVRLVPVDSAGGVVFPQWKGLITWGAHLC